MSQVDNAKIIEKIPFFRGLSHHQVLKAYGKGAFLSKMVLRARRCMSCLRVSSRFVKVPWNSLEYNPWRSWANGRHHRPAPIAAIEVSEDARLMEIGKMRFDMILKNDVDLAAKVYKNLLDSLSHRLRANNAQLVKVGTREIAASAI